MSERDSTSQMFPNAQNVHPLRLLLAIANTIPMPPLLCTPLARDLGKKFSHPPLEPESAISASKCSISSSLTLILTSHFVWLCDRRKFCEVDKKVQKVGGVVVCGSVSRTAAEVAFEIRDYGAGPGGRSRQPIKSFLYPALAMAGAMAKQQAHSVNFIHFHHEITFIHLGYLRHHEYTNRCDTDMKSCICCRCYAQTESFGSLPAAHIPRLTQMCSEAFTCKPGCKTQTFIFCEWPDAITFAICIHLGHSTIAAYLHSCIR